MARRNRALSDGTSTSGGAGCLILFGLVFGGFGSIFLVIFFLLPLWRSASASGWVTVPCTILDSRVGESDDSTYRVEVRYEYRFRPGMVEADGDGPRYESTRYDFSEGIYSSGRSSKAEEVARLAPGTKTTCQVDPQHPDQAVLIAELPTVAWFGLIAVIFPLIGIGLVIGGLRARRTSKLQREGRLALSGSASSSAQLRVTEATDDGTGPVELRTVQGRLGKALGIGFFALIWNGIVWTIMAVAIIPGLRSGSMFEWFPLLFLSLFALIGLVVIGAFFHQLLALTNPRLRLTASRRTLHPGDWLDLEWECAGNPTRVTSLTIALEGRESATYTRGTNTVTDTHAFARVTLATLSDAAAMLSGRTRLQIPLDAVPTFIARHNKLEWRLIVRGEIPRWPDIADEYEFVVLPPWSSP